VPYQVLDLPAMICAQGENGCAMWFSAKRDQMGSVCICGREVAYDCGREAPFAFMWAVLGETEAHLVDNQQ